MWLSAVFYLFGALFALSLISDFLMFLKLQKFYSNPRVQVLFGPKLLLVLKMMQDFKTDPFKSHRQIMSKTKNKDWIVMPAAQKSGARFFIPRSEKAFKEYFKLEIKNFDRFNVIGEKGLLEGIFATNTEGMHRRAFFSKLFNFENMKKMHPGMKTIVQEHIKTLKAKVQKRPDGVVDIRKDFMIDLIDDISTFLVLGQRTGNSITVLGDTFMNKVKEVFQASLLDLSMSPVNLFTFGLARKLGFDPVMNRVRAIKAALSEVATHEYKRVFNEFDSEAVNRDESTKNSVINLLVRHNKEVGEKGNGTSGGEEFTDKPLSMDRVVDMILAFILAGSDTTFNATSSTLSLLAEHPEIQDRIRKEILEDPQIQNSEYTFENLDSKPVLGAAMKESMRLVPPAPMGFWRVATKPTKICGITIQKGDLIQLSYIAQGVDPSVFKERMQFDPERFLQEGKSAHYPKIGKTDYLPFSLGQRACQGKNLAELILKTVVAEVLKTFKLVENVGDLNTFKSEPGYGFGDNRIQLQVI